MEFCNPQGYRLSTASRPCFVGVEIPDLYETSVPALEESQCTVQRLAGTKLGVHFHVPQTSTTGFATCSVAYWSILNQKQGEEDSGSVVGNWTN